MASKKTVRRTKSTRSTPKRSAWQSYGLLVGIIAVVLIAVIAIVVLSQRNPGSATTSPGDVSMDKSKGSENAPVVVVEYGDFQ